MPKEEVISAESEILALLESHPDGVTNEELLQMTASIEGRIYSLIEESDKMGIWIREIRSRTGLSQAQVRKALKVLEQRKLVKSVKVITFSACIPIV
ncbi:unnamed protein product [Toxocara canis]|uniref:MarR family transcriptional regulator n=1 Tax=Toxocara canis TaxID=6265 RepID=A0A183UZ41_TOXCA|nr:unnamed protein product [Toxocara canis]